jgi:hypothetical protein
VRQQYQMIEGEIKRGIDAKLFHATIAGEAIAFTIADTGTPRSFAGRVAGAEMSGVIRTEGLPELRWRAKRL